ncbi:MAG: hypothetical protein COB85_03720 [Bacteroidetes bacterium]|nr:MAG: hypothetical protein COB85_03720 [Bacteroidota bacterium]
MCYSQPLQVKAGGANPASCKLRNLAPEANAKLKPGFTYDGARIVRFKPKEEAYKKRIVMPLYDGVEYKYVFNRAEYPIGAEINIYNGNVNARLLFSSADFDESENLLTYKTTSSVHVLYIEFSIPAASEVVKPGCICISTGYILH